MKTVLKLLTASLLSASTFADHLQDEAEAAKPKPIHFAGRVAQTEPKVVLINDERFGLVIVRGMTAERGAFIEGEALYKHESQNVAWYGTIESATIVYVRDLKAEKAEADKIAAEQAEYAAKIAAIDAAREANAETARAQAIQIKLAEMERDKAKKVAAEKARMEAIARSYSGK